MAYPICPITNKPMLLGKELTFVNWLNETLIPDLIDSGSESTVEDFCTLLEMVERLTGQTVNVHKYNR